MFLRSLTSKFAKKLNSFLTGTIKNKIRRNARMTKQLINLLQQLLQKASIGLNCHIQLYYILI